MGMKETQWDSKTPGSSVAEKDDAQEDLHWGIAEFHFKTISNDGHNYMFESIISCISM